MTLGSLNIFSPAAEIIARITGKIGTNLTVTEGLNRRTGIICDHYHLKLRSHHVCVEYMVEPSFWCLLGNLKGKEFIFRTLNLVQGHLKVISQQ